MTRKVTEQEEADARKIIHDFVPLIVRVGQALVAAVSNNIVQSQELEDSLVDLTKAIVESDKF